MPLYGMETDDAVSRAKKAPVVSTNMFQLVRKCRPVAPAERTVKLARERGTAALLKALLGALRDPVEPISRRGCRRN